MLKNTVRLLHEQTLCPEICLCTLVWFVFRVYNRTSSACNGTAIYTVNYFGKMLCTLYSFSWGWVSKLPCLYLCMFQVLFLKLISSVFYVLFYDHGFYF